MSETLPKKRGRPLLNAEDRRIEILDCAVEMIAEGGLPALSLRKLASAAGTTTMSIYTLFGSKEGLAHALYQEGFHRLVDYQQKAKKDPHPLAWVGNLGNAYRRFARENPAYYSLMINATMPLPESHDAEVAEPIARRISTEAAYRELMSAIDLCQDEGFVNPAYSSKQIADALWAIVHGLCSLELAGYCSSEQEADERFEVGSSAVLRGFLTEKGKNAALRIS